MEPPNQDNNYECTTVNPFVLSMFAMSVSTHPLSISSIESSQKRASSPTSSPLHEPPASLDTLIAPLEIPLDGRRKQRKQACRIGPVLVDDIVGVGDEHCFAACQA